MTTNYVPQFVKPVDDGAPSSTPSITTVNSGYMASDGSTQFRIEPVTLAVNYIQCQGAITGAGPSFSAQGGDTNVDMNVAAKGTGGVYFGNGYGTMFTVLDAGVEVSNQLSVSGAASGADPKLSSTRGVIINGAASQELNFTINDQTMFKARRLTGTTTDRHWTLSGGTDQARLTVEGTAGNASGIISAKGTGNVVVTSGGGTLLTIDPNSQSSGIVNSVLLRGALTGSPATIRGFGETDASLLLGPKSGEAGTLQLEVANFVNRLIVTGVTFNTPTTGFSITISDTVAELHLTPAGTLASGTITLPAAPYNGQTVTVSTTQTVTALTVSPNSGQSVSGAPTTITAATPFTMRYRTSTTQWRRVG